MITMFSEEVEVTSTSLDCNTLYVESFEEVFYGVYEFKINNEILIAEKVGVNQNDPVVSVPVVEANGNKKEMHFTLKRGAQRVLLGSSEQLVEETAEIKEPEEPEEPVVPSNSVFYVDNFEEIHFGVYEFELNGSKQIAEQVDTSNGAPVVEVPIGDGTVRVVLEKATVKVPDTLNESTIVKEDIVSKEEKIRAEIGTLTNDFNDLRTETKDIVSDVESLRDAIFIEFASNSDNYRVEESDKLRAFVDEKVAALKETNNVIAEKLEAHVKDSLDAKFGSFVDRVDTSEKNVNKALSRIGVVNKELTESKAQFDTIKDQLFDDIEDAEARIKQYYTDHIKTVEESVFDNVRKEEILDVIKHSKMDVLAELTNNNNGLNDQLKKGFYKHFNAEMVNIKRLIELNGGGGGGISDAPIDGTGAAYVRKNGRWERGAGSDVTSLSGNWQDTFTTVAANSATWLTGPGTTNKIPVFTAANTIDDSIISQDGSDIVIDGSATVTGSLDVTGNLVYLDTLVSVTSALSVVNTGTSPALYAEQAGVGEPIAKFVDSEGGSVTIGDGGKLAANALSAIECLETGGKILSAGSDLNVLFSNCQGTVTTAGTLLSGNDTTLGVDSGALEYLNQSACPGIDCTGTITTAGTLLSGNDTTLGINSGALEYLNQSACAGIDCVGDVTGIDAGTAMEVTDGNTATPTVGVTSACNTAWNNKTTCLGTITTAGALLSGNATTIGVNTGALDYLNQSACPGIDCVGTVVVGDISSFTDCTGTVTTAGAGLSGTSTQIGLAAATYNALDQSACSGIDCTGTMTSVSVSDGLETTGGNAPTLGIATACNTKWDQSGCAGILCVGDVTGIDAGTAMEVTDGSTSTPTVGVTAACNTAWNNKTTCIGTVVASDISSFTDCTGTITTAGALLSGNSTTLGVNSGALDYLNQSACAGIDCVGTVVAGDISSFTDCIGTVVASDISSFTDCVGTITTAGALLSGNSTTLGVNSGALDYLNQSACAGIDCVGTVVAGDISSFTDCIGTVVASDISSFTTCVGDVTGIDAGDGITVNDGATATPEVTVDSSVVRTSGSQTIGGSKTFSSDIVQQPSSSVTPAANGDLVVEATNDTTLTFKLKGADGTVRSATITLS